MMAQQQKQIPNILPILPLTEYVLLPSIVTTLVVLPVEASHLTEFDYVICIPLANKKKEKTNHTDLSQLFHYGCVAKVIEVDRTVPNTCALKVEGICRSRIRDITCNDGLVYQALLEHEYGNMEELRQEDCVQFQSLINNFVENMRLIGVSYSVLNSIQELAHNFHISHVANLLLCIIDTSYGDKLRVLELSDTKAKLQQVNYAVDRYLQTIQNTAIGLENETQYDGIRRKFYLLQEVNTISNQYISHEQEGGSRLRFTAVAEDDEEILELIKKLNDANLPDHAVVSVRRDLNRLRKLPESSSDSAVLRIYIEYISDLPWQKKQDSELSVNMSFAKHQLDADHFGIDHVKKRILEYLAVLKVKKDAKPPILCFVGPPGVGKTTLGKSIAAALSRKFQRMSLGGVRDEAEIRGHRRTYVGALPGLFIHGMRQCGVKNPVFLLDEIDKLVQGTNQGDPAAALLEVLDPAQNSTFMDHFINIPYDLSSALFIATANSLDTIPRPLLDRMEVIHLDGYTFNEKLHISQTHLIPKQMDAHGLDMLEISDSVVMHVAERYTRESGVRGLERLMASICRYKCREYADLVEAGALELFEKRVQINDIEQILGAAPFENDEIEGEEIAGIATGLAYSSSGNGGIMMIEANHMPGSGELKLTGSLGEVIKESAQLAVSWVKANAYALKLSNFPKEDIFKKIDLHIHMPSGAVPKDGPSAGITMVTCLISLMSGNNIPRTTAMTGELTLRGQVRPVGGIKEKVIAAHRAGIKKIILPAANRRDIKNYIPQDIQNEMSFHYCKSAWDVIESAFEQHATCGARWEPRYTSSL